MRKKVNLQMAQETSNDVSWAFFLVLPFLFPPCEQLLAAVVLGAGAVPVSVIVVVFGQWHHRPSKEKLKSWLK